MRNLNIKISKRFYVDILFGLLLLVTFLRYGIEINIPTVVMLGVSLLIITLGNSSEIITMCLCCIPLHSSFDYLYVIIYGSIVLFIKNYRKIKLDYMLITIFIIFLWEIFHSITGVFLIKQLIGIMMPFIFVLVLHFCRGNKLNYHYMAMMFSRFVTIIGINLFIRTLSKYGLNFTYAIQQMGRLGHLETESSILGGQINPNSLGVLCVLAITMLLQNYLYNKKEKKVILYILVLILIGMLTISKTYFVLLVLTGCLFVVERKGSAKDKIKTLMIISIVAIFGGIILINIFPSVVETFVERWNVKDLSSGRFEIMEAASEALKTHPKILWFGIGLQNYSEEVLKYVYYAPHNVIHEIIFSWGMPGLILFILYIISLVAEAKKVNKNIKIANYIPLIIIVAKAIAGHWITSNYTMLTISLIYISLFFDFTNDKKIS